MSSIDPVEATRVYREHVLATKGADLDEQGRLMLAEDLRSPCTEEVAVFQAFSKSHHRVAAAVRRRRHRTHRHTLLLLDATGSYHREVARQLGDRQFTTPLMRLQDPELPRSSSSPSPKPPRCSKPPACSANCERAGIHPGPG